MEDGEHAQALLGGELAHEVEDLEAVVEVEVADRLVEQQHPRLLGERLREREALQVAAGELVGGLVGEAERVGERERLVDDLAVALARAPRSAAGAGGGPSRRSRARAARRRP